jgi:hypothetical protein
MGMMADHMHMNINDRKKMAAKSLAKEKEAEAKLIPEK